MLDSESQATIKAIIDGSQPPMLLAKPNRAGRVITIALGLWIAAQSMFATKSAADDATFREFPDSEVATPGELVRSLTRLRFGSAESRVPENPPGSVNPGGTASEPPQQEPPANPPTSPGSASTRIPTLPMGGGQPGANRPPIIPPLNRPGQRPPILPQPRPPRGANRIPITPPATAGSNNPRLRPPSLPNSPLTNRPAVSNSGEREAPAPTGSFRDRLNRILLDAAQDSFAKKAGDSASLSRFEKAFSQATDSVKASLDGRMPGWRNRLSSQWKNVTQKARRSRDKSVGWLRRSTRASSNAGESNGATAWWLVLLGLLLIVTVGYFSRHKIAKYLARPPELTLKQMRFTIRRIDSRRDLIVAVDRFLLWSIGSKADSWNCQVIRDSLAATYPQLDAMVEDLVDDYERARYAPESLAISPAEFGRCSATLHHLVAVEAADGE